MRAITPALPPTPSLFVSISSLRHDFRHSLLMLLLDHRRIVNSGSERSGVFSSWIERSPVNSVAESRCRTATSTSTCPGRSMTMIWHLWRGSHRLQRNGLLRTPQSRMGAATSNLCHALQASGSKLQCRRTCNLFVPAFCVYLHHHDRHRPLRPAASLSFTSSQHTIQGLADDICSQEGSHAEDGRGDQHFAALCQSMGGTDRG